MEEPLTADQRLQRRRPSVQIRVSTSLKPPPQFQTPTQSKTCMDKRSFGGIKYAIAWITYVLIGSQIFIELEKSSEIGQIEHEQWLRFKALILYGEANKTEFLALKQALLTVCLHPDLNSSFDALLSEEVITERGNGSTTLIGSAPGTYDWISKIEENCFHKFYSIGKIITSRFEGSFIDAVFYTMTLVTTIGFGNISPSTVYGRLFSIVYALVGVPLTCILMAKNSEMLSHRMLRVYEGVKKRYKKRPKMLLCLVTWLFLSLGFVIFMFVPSVAFVYIEDWTYSNALYFTFITLTTIGFGDLTAGYNSDYNMSVTLLDCYKMFIVIWIMCALGYWVLLLSFLQKAIKSNAKTIRRTFTTKKLAKQAEFIKQIMTKVRSDDDDSSSLDREERLHVMAMMVESLTKKSSYLSPMESQNVLRSVHTTKTASPQPSLRLLDEDLRKTPLEETPAEKISKEKTTGGSCSGTSSSKFDLPFTFDDLLNAEVCINTESLSGIESLANQSQSFEELDSSLREPLQNLQLAGFNQDINVKLKEILALLILSASLEEEEEESVVADFPPSGNLHNKRESVPLLRHLFTKKPHLANKHFKRSNSLFEECNDLDDNFKDVPGGHSSAKPMV